MGTTTDAKIKVTVTDVSGQIRRNAKIPSGTHVSEIIESLLPNLNLPSFDSTGTIISYHIRNDTSGQKLTGSDLAGDVLQENDTMRLMPEITPAM